MLQVVELTAAVRALQAKLTKLEDGPGRQVEVGKDSGTRSRTAVKEQEPQREVGWKVVRGRGTRPVRMQGLQRQLPVQNRFEVLSEAREEPSVEFNGRVDVFGDSRVRGLGKQLSKGRKNRQVTCVPGAKVEDIRAKLGVASVATSTDRQAVITHVGVNDVTDSTGRSEEVVSAFRALVGRLKEDRGRGIVTGVVPRLRASPEWYSRALGLNERVGRMCQESGIVFLDLWDKFFGRPELFSQDGLHFSWQGVQLMSNEYEKVLSSLPGN